MACSQSELDRARRYRERHPDRAKAADHKWRQKNRLHVMFNAAKARARRKGIEFTIHPSDITIPDVCPVFGVPLSDDARMTTPTLDRLDNALGYVPGNIAVISWRANWLKSDATLAELQALTDWLREQE